MWHCGMFKTFETQCIQHSLTHVSLCGGHEVEGVLRLCILVLIRSLAFVGSFAFFIHCFHS